MAGGPRPGAGDPAMQGLDTPVLLDLLRGRPDALRWVRSLDGEEVVTTELNLLELTALARRARGAARDRRLAALAHLRRSVTVLPIDERATAKAAAGAGSAPARHSWFSWAILGTLGASGCTEWVTYGDLPFPEVAGMSVTRIGKRYPMTRKKRYHDTPGRK